MSNALGRAYARLALVGLASVALGATQDRPATMQAARYHEFGKAEVLKLEAVAVPVPSAGEVLVRVHAASVNPVDWKLRSGRFGKGSIRLPAIPGFDISGTIVKLGEQVESWKVGDEVIAFLSIQRGGASAEYALAVPAEMAHKPKELDHAHSAAIPLAALTAWQALFDRAKLESGQTVLVHAGAGGVGHFAVQFAKAKGARVLATASKANLAFLTELGAEVTIDYQAQKFEEFAREVDVVFDMIGGETQKRSLGVLKKGGYLVSIVEPPDQAELAARGLSGSVFLVEANAKQLAEIVSLIDGGQVKPTVGARFPLAEIRAAHELSETGHGRGKIVLEIAR